MTLEEEFADYLNQPSFARFIDAWITKYQSLGYLGGKIQLSHLNAQEVESLNGLLGLHITNGQLQITYHQFLRIISTTRFDGADFFKVIELLKKQKVYSKKEIREYHEKKLSQFKNELLSRFIDTDCYDWLHHYLNNDKYVKRYYEDNAHQYTQIIEFVCIALNILPIYESRYELLAIFAQKVTKDPHYFDEDLSRDLLLKGISFLFDLEEISKSSEEITRIYYVAGILRDDLSNYCYICHNLPQDSSLSWQGFYNDYEPWNMNLYNIYQIQSYFYPQSIYIFENPSVFRALSSFIKEQNLSIGLISSNGQINLATYILLDKLVESHCHLYYAGDFDPEGLVIADKLKQKYQDHLTLFCYEKSLFELIKVHQLEISQNRIQMLQHIQNQKLLFIGKLIREEISFGYQEGLIDIYKKVLSNKK